MDEKLTDSDLLKFWVNEKSSRALGELFQRHSSSVYHLCLSVLKNGADAEDATQKTFIKIMRFANSKKDEGDLKSWILKTAINTCKDELKHMVTHKKHSHSAAEMKFRSEDNLQVVDNELSEVVMSSLKAMDMKLRMPVWLKHYEDLSVKEISEVLGRPEKTIRTQISRGIEKLKEMVSKVKPAASLSAIFGILSYQKAHAAVPQALAPKLVSLTNESARMAVSSVSKFSSVGVVAKISAAVLIVTSTIAIGVYAFNDLMPSSLGKNPIVSNETEIKPRDYYEWDFQNNEIPSEWSLVESDVSFIKDGEKTLLNFKEDLFTAFLNVPSTFIDYEVTYKIKSFKKDFTFWVTKTGENLKVHFKFHPFFQKINEMQEITMRRVNGIETLWRNGVLLMAYVSDAKDDGKVLLKLQGPFLLDNVKIKKIDSKIGEDFSKLKRLAEEVSASQKKSVYFKVKNPYPKYGPDKLDTVVY